MRILTLLKVTLLSLSLTACVAPLLAMGPGQLMWALLKPMVGLDPNTTNLFEQPVIKTRMTGLLGPHYDTTINLLKTASELQQEGPLFYVMSRYTPQQDSEKAGLVWNSDTNQMAVLLNTEEQTKVFSESHTGHAAVWPSAMQDWLSAAGTATAKTGQSALGQALAPASNNTEAPPSALLPMEVDGPAAKAEPVAKADSRLQDELARTQAQLQAAEKKLKALAAAQPAKSAKPTAPTKEQSREQAEAAMQALLNAE
ncbi:hypothetical protein [Zobellella aerophila]|uniref:Uncharacterized protein n=1 Tax=Zobellella aerophila TaxID=870480 RepID=A0ABP6VKB5_9GAMM